MLQMITVDGKKDTDNIDDLNMNKTLRMDGSEGIRTKDLLLPQVGIMGNTKSSLNMSADNIKLTDGDADEVGEIDPYKPKM